MKLPGKLWQTTNQPTDRQMDRRAHREVSRPITMEPSGAKPQNPRPKSDGQSNVQSSFALEKSNKDRDIHKKRILM